MSTISNVILNLDSDFNLALWNSPPRPARPLFPDRKTGRERMLGCWKLMRECGRCGGKTSGSHYILIIHQARPASRNGTNASLLGLIEGSAQTKHIYYLNYFSLWTSRKVSS